MTKEELKEHCERQIKMCEEWAKGNGREPSGKTYEEHKLILELLEQQPCEDCVSRQAVLDTLMKYEKPCDDRQDFYLDSTNEFEEEINELPPVTPTHGTCKDCKQLGVMDCGYYCKLNHWGKISTESNYGGMGDFYCADFERRE